MAGLDKWINSIPSEKDTTKWFSNNTADWVVDAFKRIKPSFFSNHAKTKSNATIRISNSNKKRRLKHPGVTHVNHKLVSVGGKSSLSENDSTAEKKQNCSPKESPFSYLITSPISEDETPTPKPTPKCRTPEDAINNSSYRMRNTDVSSRNHKRKPYDKYSRRSSTDRKYHRRSISRKSSPNRKYHRKSISRKSSPDRKYHRRSISRKSSPDRSWYDKISSSSRKRYDDSRKNDRKSSTWRKNNPAPVSRTQKLLMFPYEEWELEWGPLVGCDHMMLRFSDEELETRTEIYRKIAILKRTDDEKLRCKVNGIHVTNIDVMSCDDYVINVLKLLFEEYE